MPEGELEMLAQHLRQAYRSAVQAQLDAAGLHAVGHPLLLCILRGAAQEPDLTQRELARRLGVSPAAVATSLKSLEKGGYIQREPQPGDARCNRLRLTEEEREQIGVLLRNMLHNLRDI